MVHLRRFPPGEEEVLKENSDKTDGVPELRDSVE